MNTSIITIRTVRSRGGTEVISGFCFLGFTLKKGYTPLRSVVVLFLGFQSDDLFIGVVAPTTCSLLLVS